MNGVDFKGRRVIKQYIDEVMEWGKRIRLVGYRDRRDIEEKLLKVNEEAIKLMEVAGEGADVGSGNGSLMVVLKVMHPDVRVYCIERNKRKAVVINEIVRRLGLKGVEVVVDDLVQIGSR